MAEFFYALLFFEVNKNAKKNGAIYMYKHFDPNKFGQ